MKKIALFLSFSLFSIQLLAGGGWTKTKGTGYLKLSQWWVISDQHYVASGQIDPNLTIGLFNTSLYGEYGITDRLTGIVYFPFFSRNYHNNQVSGTTGEINQEGEALNFIGDTDISLKYGIIQNSPIFLSATLTLGLPLGKTGEGELGILQTGDGEFNQMLKFDMSSSKQLGKLNLYGSIYSGVNNRTEGFSDEFHYGLEVGTVISEKVILSGRLYGVESFENGDLNVGTNSTSVFANNAEHFTYSLEAGYKLNKKFGVSASYAKALSGQLIFANPAYSVGIFYEW